MVLLVFLKEIGIVPKQFSEFFRSDSVASYRDSLIIDRNYLINPAFLHGILQRLDLQSVLLDIRFEGFNRFRFDLTRDIYAGCMGLGIMRYLIKIEYSISPLVVSGLEKPHGFGQACRGDCR